MLSLLNRIEVNMLRTKTCGELTEANVGEKVTLCGWVSKVRNLGFLVFVDLRDRYGITQISIDAKEFEKEPLKSEYCVQVEGEVILRSSPNKNIPTGLIEIKAEKIKVFSESLLPPFIIADKTDALEDTRLKSRYLDLRRPTLQKNLVLRAKMIQSFHHYFDENGFLEVETPTLIKSTPEGARDYLVPSRTKPGCFYALPQSPQIYKQLLMVGNIDRYYQVARCYRDEDLRADRQPEFTQLDVEMSFVERQDVLNIIQGSLKKVFKDTIDVDLEDFAVLPYSECISKYGSDKPDLRFDMAFTDVTELVKDTEFKVFRSVIDNGGIVKGIVVPGDAGIPRRELDDLVAYVNRYGAKGLAWACFNEDGSIKSQIMKFLGEDTIRNIGEKMGAKGGDLVLMIADKPATVARALGELRLEMARRMNMIDEDKLAFTWVTDFPMFEYNEDEKRYVAMHHPFTMPRHEDLDKLQSDPGSVKAIAYDMVLNGVEIGGGSLRIYQSDVQEKVFKAIGLSEEEAKSKFGFMLDAFKYGAPPHAGCAFGLDRLVMLMAKRQSIRDVIAFPKTQSASDIMSQAPSEVEPKQLKELHIKPDVEEEEQSLV